MSSETLSQSEIDKLFGASESSDPYSSQEDTDPDIERYDFRRPSRISREQQRSVEAIYGLVASALEGWIRAHLRGQATITLQAVEQVTFGEFVLSLSAPCNTYVYSLLDRGHELAVDIGRKFSFFSVDRLLGGSGEPAFQERSLSTVEQSVVRRVADRIVDELADAWEDHVYLKPSHDRFESTPEMLQLVNREDPVLVGTLEVAFEEQSSLVEICLPFAAVEDFFTATGDSNVHHRPESQRAREENQEKLKQTLRRTKVPLKVLLPDFRLPVRELADLEEGDVLPTRLSRDTPLEIYLSGQKRYEGEPGRVGKNLAVRITDSVATERPGESKDDVLRRLIQNDQKRSA